jgi:Dolichyl-phosphate-mannose-protein mannosyltransferase
MSVADPTVAGTAAKSLPHGPQGVDSHPDRTAAVIVVAGFFFRLWLAHATFFNADEAWHYATALQSSLRETWHASLGLYHPPLLIFVLYFWHKLGNSDLMLRLPCVISGSLFCWFYYKWLKLVVGYQAALVGVLLVSLLPTMVGVSADLRQYPLMLMFVGGAAFFLELAIQTQSVARMLLSGGFLLLGMVSHYSGFLAAAALGIYVLGLLVYRSLSGKLLLAWIPAQLAGIALAWFFYSVQIKKLALARGNESARLMANWYLPQFYYHPGHDHLVPFLIKGTFGIFRFTFAWVVIGHVATLLFFAGLVVLLRRGTRESRLTALLLFAPFLVNWAAAALGVYPFGRTRHSIFVAVFGLAGVSVATVEICKRKTNLMVGATVAVILLCQVFGTQPWLDMLPLADRRYELIDQAMQVLRSQVSVDDVVYLDKATEYQVRRYLCPPEPLTPDRSISGFESFQCGSVRVVSSYPNDDAVLAATFPEKWQQMARLFGLPPGSRVWVVEGGWISGFAEMLQARYADLPILEVHRFGRYFEIFELRVP